jgi:hypothetical protein
MSGMDYKMANNTFAGFVTFVKWGTIVSFSVGAIVVLLISH